MSNPINLTTITERSTLAQINNNFRKLQAELSGFRQNVEPRLRASEEFQDYFNRYIGGGRPVSRQQAMEYTDEQIAAKEAEILEELDSRIGDVNAKIDNLEQLGEDLIEQISTSITELENELTETKEALSKKADLLWTEAQLALKADRELLDTMVTDLEESIATKADAEWVEGRLQTKADVENTYTKQEVDNALNSKVSVTTYTVDKEGFIQQFEDHESRITQTEEAISQTVSKTEFEEVQNELGDVVTRLSNAETAIIQNAEQIELRATKDEVDGLENRLGLAETAIMQNSQEIQLRATKAELDEIEDRVSSAETMITQNAEQIQLRATKSELEELATDVAGLETRLSNAETSITQNAEEIELRATKTEVQQLENELNAISTRMSDAETAIIQNAEEINLRATKEEVQLIEDEVSSISQNVANLTVAYDNISSEVSRVEQDLDGKIQANTSLIQQTAQGINARIDDFRYEYDQDKTDILSSVEQNRSEINALSDQIQLRVTREEFESLQIGGTNLIKNSNDFITGWTAYQGANVQVTKNVAVQDWRATDASRITINGGTHQIKYFKTILAPSLNGQTYTLSVWVKNLTDKSFIISSNIGIGMKVIDPNWSGRIVITVQGNGTSYLQLSIRTLNVNDSLDFILWRDKAEIGQKATDWTPAPEDVDERIDGAINRISQAEATLNIHADQIEAKAEKSEVYTRSEVDSALGEKVDTTVFTEQIGTLTTSINSVSARVSNTEAEINSITGEIEDVLNQVSSLEVTTNGIVQSVSSIEGELSDIGNRLTQTESSITTLSNEIELKASKTEVDTIQSTLDDAVAVLNVLPGMIAAKVDRNGVISAINLSPESAKIRADIIEFDGHVFGQNATFTGTVEGASIIGSTVISNSDNNGTFVISGGSAISEIESPAGPIWRAEISKGSMTLSEHPFPDDPPTFSSTITPFGVTTRNAHIENLFVYSFFEPLWTGQAYPLNTQTIRPSKRLSDCATGWILRFQRYIVGTGTQENNFHYVHIPKIHEHLKNGAGIRITLGEGTDQTITKYIYVYDDRIVGHASNDQNRAQNRALTGVFEY